VRKSWIRLRCEMRRWMAPRDVWLLLERLSERDGRHRDLLPQGHLLARLCAEGMQQRRGDGWTHLLPSMRARPHQRRCQLLVSLPDGYAGVRRCLPAPIGQLRLVDRADDCWQCWNCRRRCYKCNAGGWHFSRNRRSWWPCDFAFYAQLPMKENEIKQLAYSFIFS